MSAKYSLIVLVIVVALCVISKIKAPVNVQLNKAISSVAMYGMG